MRVDVLVVGAGFAGITAAREFAESGRSVVVMEKLPHIAGRCYDFRNEAGITVHAYGPHIFHTSDERVWRWVNRFSSFRTYQHRVLSFVNESFVSFPINLDTVNQVFGLDLREGEVRDFLDGEASRSKFDKPPRNFRDAVVSQVGERLYRLFFEGYTRKQWQREPEELDAALAARIPVREDRDDRYFSDPYQGIPRSGYTALAESILAHPGIEVMLGTNYFEHRDQLDAKFTYYTGPLDEFFEYRFGRLEYRSLRTVTKTFPQERFQAAAVVNYPNDHGWIRSTEFKWFLDERSEHTTVMFEYPSKEGQPCYVVPTDENNKQRERYLRLVRPMEEAGSHAFVGRLAEYRYFNMDQVISESLSRVACIVRGETHACRAV